jgi:hypothetical protein
MTNIYYEGKLYSEEEFDRLTFKPIEKPAKPKKSKAKEVEEIEDVFPTEE